MVLARDGTSCKYSSYRGVCVDGKCEVSSVSFFKLNTTWTIANFHIVILTALLPKSLFNVKVKKGRSHKLVIDGLGNYATRLNIWLSLLSAIVSQSDAMGCCFPPTPWISVASVRVMAAAAAELQETSGVVPPLWVSLLVKDTAHD